MEEDTKDEQYTASFVQCNIMIAASGYLESNAKWMWYDLGVDAGKVCFHAVDDKLKDYFLETSIDRCKQRLQKRGIIGVDEACEFAIHQLIPLSVKHLLWLEYVNPNERRMKKLTLGRPFRTSRLSKIRKTRSMSPIRRGDDGDAKSRGQSLAETRRRLRREASVAASARDNETRRELAERYGPWYLKRKCRAISVSSNCEV